MARFRCQLSVTLKRKKSLDSPGWNDIKNRLYRLNQNALTRLFSLLRSTFARMKIKANGGILMVISVD